MSKKSFKRKLFALLMALCMVASYMPGLAYAADEEKTLTEAATAPSQTVTEEVSPEKDTSKDVTEPEVTPQKPNAPPTQSEGKESASDKQDGKGTPKAVDQKDTKDNAEETPDKPADKEEKKEFVEDPAADAAAYRAALHTKPIRGMLKAIPGGTEVSYVSECNGSGDDDFKSGRKFTVSYGGNDYIGTCAEPFIKAGEHGKATARVIDNNSDMAKAMYYFGYVKGFANSLGKSNKWNNGYRLELICQTIQTGTNLLDRYGSWCPDGWNPYHENDPKDAIENYLKANSQYKSVTVPSNFEISYCKAANGLQDFVIWRFVPEGYLEMYKVSSNSQLPIKNPGVYGLAGAVYYVYTDSACTTRAKDADGNIIALTTGNADSNGKATTNKVKVTPGTYYVKEQSAPSGYSLDTKVYTVKVEGDATGSATSVDKPNVGAVCLQKSAESTPTDFVTEAPNNYTLQGAVYKLYTDTACTTEAKDAYNQAITLTTDASGKTATIEVVPGTYFAKEITASKGFMLDSTGEGSNRKARVIPINVTTANTVSNPAKISSTEPPRYAMFNVLLDKQSEEYGYRRLLGAEYTLSYYDVAPNTTDVSGKTAKKTWTFKVVEGEDEKTHRKLACIDFNNDEPVSGGAMYKDAAGNSIMPIGVFTLKETKAPRGLALDPTTYMGKVESTDNDKAPNQGAEATINGSDNMFVSYDEKFKLANMEPKRSIKLNLQKKDGKTGDAAAQGADREYVKGSLEGAVYEVYMEDHTLLKDPKVGEIVTDAEGKGSLDKDARTNDPLNPGKYYIKEVKASDGYLLDSYHEKEEKDKYENGRHVVMARVDDESENIVFEYNVDSLEEPHRVEIYKTDLVTGEELPGATLQVLDSEGNIIEQWESTKEPHDIYCLHDETQGLKDGKYTLREITAPYGYDTAEDVEFEVKSNEPYTKVEMKNAPITLKTTATDKETYTHNGKFSENEIIKDVVKFENLYAGRTYTFEGTLMDKKTGEPLLDKDGNKITASKEYTPEGEKGALVSGEVEIEFTVDASEFTKETTVVAFETVSRQKRELAMHAELKDENQTIRYGGIVATTAVDKNSKSHNVLAGENTVVVDTVEYKNLSPKDTYVVTGELYDKTTGELTGIKSEATFKPEGESGTVDVEFTFDASAMEGHTLVAYEVLYVKATIDGEEKDVELDEHKDPEDEDQTVHIPKFRTTATSTETKEHISMAKKDVVIQDVVKYENLIPGKEYLVKGKMVDKDTGNDVVIDGENITSEATFTPEEPNGEVVLEFKFNAVKLRTKSIVAFEEVYEEKEWLIGVHADITDKEQTVDFPGIGTTAIDSKTKDHVASADSVLTILDTVKYEKLLPGKTYTMKGKLMSKKTGNPIQYNGQDVTAEKTFTAEKANGEVVLTFTVGADAMKGDSAVAFEECYYDGVLVAAHTDIEDREQTVDVPEIGTTAVDSDTEEHISNGDDEVTIIDTVEYKNLTPGKEYTVIGKLTNKATGGYVVIDGKELESKKTFTPSSPNGTVKIEFTFDGTALRGSRVVAYEYVYYKNILVAAHANINDADQSVDIPKVATKVGRKEGKYVIDKVEYTNLIPGETYIVKGEFVSKSSGNVVRNSEGETEFVPDSPNGYIEVKLNPANGKGSLVAFEEIYIKNHNDEEKLVGEHKDIDDKAQTYVVPSKSPKTGDDFMLIFFTAAFMLSACLYLVLKKRDALRK